MFDCPNISERAELISPVGDLFGHRYAYRGAVIDGNPGGTLFRIALPRTPIDGWRGLVALDVVCRLIDACLDHGIGRRVT